MHTMFVITDIYVLYKYKTNIFIKTNFFFNTAMNMQIQFTNPPLRSTLSWVTISRFGVLMPILHFKSKW